MPENLFLLALVTEHISTTLLSILSPRGLLLLSRTCRSVKTIVSAYVQVAYNVNTVLKRFFPDPTAFRTMQARTGTLILGSTALQFFDRAFYPSSDLDLYAHWAHHRNVGKWLLKEGYTFCPARRQTHPFASAVMNAVQDSGLQYVMPGVSAIYTFQKEVLGEQLKVQIIVARRAPMEVILGFHSTCVMNVISYHKAYCLFPRATLEEQHSLLSWSSQGRSKRRQEGLDKYSARGFLMLEHLEEFEFITPRRGRSFPLGPRWLGDIDTWVISLDTNGVQLPPSPSTLDPVIGTSFFMRYDDNDGAIMDFSVLESPVLKYAYVMVDEGMTHYISRAVLARTLLKDLQLFVRIIIKLEVVVTN